MDRPIPPDRTPERRNTAAWNPASQPPLPTALTREGMERVLNDAPSDQAVAIPVDTEGDVVVDLSSDQIISVVDSQPQPVSSSDSHRIFRAQMGDNYDLFKQYERGFMQGMYRIWNELIVVIGNYSAIVHFDNKEQDALLSQGPIQKLLELYSGFLNFLQLGITVDVFEGYLDDEKSVQLRSAVQLAKLFSKLRQGESIEGQQIVEAVMELNNLHDPGNQLCLQDGKLVKAPKVRPVTPSAHPPSSVPRRRPRL